MKFMHAGLVLLSATLLRAEIQEITITSKLLIDSDAQEEILNELKIDGKALTRKYAEAPGVSSVETTVDASSATRCDACGGRPKSEETKCSCNKPKPKGEAIDETTKCSCSKPKPKGESLDEATKCNCGKPKPVKSDDSSAEEATKCSCNKPRPKGEAVDEATKCNCGKPKPVKSDDSAAAECTECKGHLQDEDKIETNASGQELCSDCKDTLRSCSSCCKKKCCKKCKKCCKKCCSSCTTSTCTSCCS